MDAEDQSALVESFWHVARELRARSATSLAPFDITPAQARALDVIGRSGVLRLSALSEQLRIAPRSTTDFVDALEQRGLVRRVPDADDRRATLVQLTPVGDDLADRLRAERSAGAAAYFAGLSERDRRALGRILRTLATGTPVTDPARRPAR